MYFDRTTSAEGGACNTCRYFNSHGRLLTVGWQVLCSCPVEGAPRCGRTDRSGELARGHELQRRLGPLDQTVAVTPGTAW
jgi:hypothetical protein